MCIYIYIYWNHIETIRNHSKPHIKNTLLHLAPQRTTDLWQGERPKVHFPTCRCQQSLMVSWSRTQGHHGTQGLYVLLFHFASQVGWIIQELTCCRVEDRISTLKMARNSPQHVLKDRLGETVHNAPCFTGSPNAHGNRQTDGSESSESNKSIRTFESSPLPNLTSNIHRS